ncbi:hypothetical protein ACPA0G_18185, partial [Vreelandella venusta]
MSSATDCVATLIDGFQKRRPIRAGSLIITVYGDSIVPRGGTADADSECNTLTGWLMGFHGTWSSARSSLLSD